MRQTALFFVIVFVGGWMVTTLLKGTDDLDARLDRIERELEERRRE